LLNLTVHSAAFCYAAVKNWMQDCQQGENWGEVSLHTNFHILDDHRREKVCWGAIKLNTVYNAYK
jgi:hypothetical protein